MVVVKKIIVSPVLAMRSWINPLSEPDIKLIMNEEEEEEKENEQDESQENRERT